MALGANREKAGEPAAPTAVTSVEGPQKAQPSTVAAVRPTAPVGLQAKLLVGGADDPYEREADDIARQVMDGLSRAAAAPVRPERDVRRSFDGGSGAGKIRRFPTVPGSAPSRPADVVRRTVQVTPVASSSSGLIQRGGKGYVDLDESQEEPSVKPKGGKGGKYGKLEEEAEPSDPKLVEAIEVVAEADEVLVHKVAEAFKEYSASKQGSKGRVSGSGEVSAKVGAEAEFKLTKEGKDFVTGIKYIAAASAKAGVEFNASGQVGVDLGPLQLAASAHLMAFAGVAAEATGSVEMGLLTGFIMEGSISAKAGVEVTAEGDISVDLADFGIGAEGWARLFAGGEASAEGSLSLTRKGLAMSGKVEAFAGVKAEAKAGVSFKFKGRPIIKLTAKASALAGVGGEASGEFSIESGKLIISGSMAAALGIGGELGVGIEIDFDALVMGVYETAQSLLAEKHPYKRFLDPFDTEPPLIKEITRLKAAQEKAKKPLTGTVVQKAINGALKKAKQDKSPDLDLIEQAVNNALTQALGPNGGNFSWQVQWSYVRSFQQHGR